MGIDPLAIAGEQRRLLLNRLLLVEAGLARVEQRFAQDLYGAFPVKRLLLGFAHSSLFGGASR
jgi:hypothetical protein